MTLRLLAPLFAPVLLIAADASVAPSAKAAESPKAAEPAKPAPRRTLAQMAEDKRVLAVELVQLTRVETQMEGVVSGMRASMDQQFDQALAGPAASQKALIEEYRTKIHAIIREGVDWRMMQPDIVKAYADTYTETELRELVAFFKSPIGKAYAEKGPRIGAAVSGIAEGRMQQIQPRIQSTFYELGLRLNQALQPAGQPGAQGQPGNPQDQRVPATR